MANEAKSTCCILSSKAFLSIVIPLIIKSNVCSVRVSALLDFRASTCFIDKDFVECHNLPLVTKRIDVPVEVIDSISFIFGNIIQESSLLLVSLKNHQNTIVFNVIKTPLKCRHTKSFLAR